MGFLGSYLEVFVDVDSYYGVEVVLWLGRWVAGSSIFFRLFWEVVSLVERSTVYGFSDWVVFVSIWFFYS